MLIYIWGWLIMNSRTTKPYLQHGTYPNKVQLTLILSGGTRLPSLPGRLHWSSIRFFPDQDQQKFQQCLPSWSPHLPAHPQATYSHRCHSMWLLAARDASIVRSFWVIFLQCRSSCYYVCCGWSIFWKRRFDREAPPRPLAADTMCHHLSLLWFCWNWS